MCYLAGTNDIGNDVVATAAYANVLATVTEARSDGIEVVVMTLSPRSGTDGWHEGRQAQLLAYNDLIRGIGNGVHIVDLYPVMGDTDPTRLAAGYRLDEVHWNPAGDVFVAHLVGAEIQ